MVIHDCGRSAMIYTKEQHYDSPPKSLYLTGEAARLAGVIISARRQHNPHLLDSPGGTISSVPYATGLLLLTTLLSSASYTNRLRWRMSTLGKVSMKTCFVASTFWPLLADQTPGTVSGWLRCLSASVMEVTSEDWMSSWRG